MNPFNRPIDPKTAAHYREMLPRMEAASKQLDAEFGNWADTVSTAWNEHCCRVLQTAVDSLHYRRANVLPTVWVSTENYQEILDAGSIEEWLRRKREREAQRRMQTFVEVNEQQEEDWPQFSRPDYEW